MTLAQINSLRDLSYAQLANLAAQWDLVPVGFLTAREWSPDRLRLRLIDSICDEELEVARSSAAEYNRVLELEEGIARDERERKRRLNEVLDA